ncbi:MAG TPA: pilin [Usitatibacter sp.]|nr:pilin [Usitatibacter sp.]
MTELINAAGVCKTSVAEYYQTKGSLPTDETIAGCSNQGTANSEAPKVATGKITVKAAGGLLTQLGAGDTLGYNPVITSATITGWDCNAAAGTTVLPKYLPAACR